MTTWLILLAGITVVVGGIIVVRIHAFVALILGALTVALFTPEHLVLRSQTVTHLRPIAEFSLDEGLVAVRSSDVPDEDCLLVLDRGPNQPLQVVGEVVVPPDTSAAADPSADTADESEGDTVTTRLLSLRPVPGAINSAADAESGALSVSRLRLIPQSRWEAGTQQAESLSIERITAALGNTCGRLAILIVAASIIGRCLLESGAADRIVLTSLAVFTERFAALAFTVAGFVLAIPVFFDTVFLLMIPLGKSMYRRTGRNYLVYVLAIVIGGTMAHSLVPPTPGPLLIASEFGLPLIRMVIGGCIVGGAGALGGLLFATFLNRRVQLPLRDDAEDAAPAVADDQSLPSLGESLLPIAIPILLIAVGTQADRLATALAGDDPDRVAGVRDGIQLLCNGNVALLIGAALGILTLKRHRSPTRDQFARSMNLAVLAAGTIILVTSAGSAFGQMLRQTSVAERLAELPGSSPVAVVVAAFLVTTLVRTAQGSATVAMITGAGVFAPLVTTGLIPVDPLYVALAIGCGSKPFSWMNDSGFLVITRTSGMTDAEGLKYATTTIAVAAMAGLAVILAGVTWFPDLPARLPS